MGIELRAVEKELLTFSLDKLLQTTGVSVCVHI